MKIKKYLAGLAVLLTVCSTVWAQAGETTLSVPGLKEPVTIRRDERSIPYIEARNEGDLYFAQGYATAADRLWQMDLLRRIARGELAEIFGRRVLEEDKRWRRYGFAKVAEESLTIMDPHLRRALENYARGVNAYLTGLDKETLPIEFRILQYQPRPWQPADSVIAGKILADALSSTWRQDLIRASLASLERQKLADLINPVTPYDVILFGKDLSPERAARQISQQLEQYEAQRPALRETFLSELLSVADQDEQIRRRSLGRIGLYAEDLAASNNWVISGKRTLDGKPLLANDPHLMPAAPGIWYMTHLAAPNLRVSGVTFPGVPGIVLGHNEVIAWGATNVGPDVQDLYREEFNAEGKYRTPRGWEKPLVRREEIKVRKSTVSTEIETEIVEFVETRNGFLVTDESGEKFALKWTAREPKNQEFEAFYFLNRAKNWDDFRRALKSYGGPTQNFVYADTAGNIGWYAAGQIPIRKMGDGSLPYNGATDEGEWIGYIPFEELPYLYNPPSGFIVTANQRIVGTNYKYPQVLRDAAPPWRARRIYDLLNTNSKVSINDVRDVQHDVFNIPHSMLAREIVEREAASPETLAALRGWDGRMTADSKAALLVNEIRGCLAKKIAADNKPVPAFVIQERVLHRAIPENLRQWLPQGFSDYSALIKTCDGEVRANLAGPQRFGPDEAKWRWGDSFVANFQHPLSTVPFIGGQFLLKFNNVNGSGQTPNVGSYVSMRHIAAPGNWDETRLVIPLGQSGNPASPHWKDQFEAWRAGSPPVFPFSREAVEKSAKEVVVLKP